MADSGQNEGGSQSRVPHPTSKKSGRGRKRGKKGKAKGQGMVEATVRSHGSSTPATTDEVRTGMEAQRQRQTASVRRGDHNLQIHSDQQLGGSDQLETAQQQGGQVPGHHTTQEQHGSQQPIQQQQSEQHASQPQTPSQLEQGTRSPERGLNLGDSDSDSFSDDIGPGGSIEGDDSLPDLSALIGANTGGIDIANNNSGDGNIEYDTQGPTDALNLDTINPDQLGPDREQDDLNDHDSVNSHLQSLLAQDARLQADVNLGLQGGVGTNPIPRPSTHALEQTRAGQLAGGHATDANPAQLQPPPGFPPYPAQQRSVLPRGLPHPPAHSPHDAQQGIDNRNTSPSPHGPIPGSHPLPSPQPASSQFRVDAPTGMTTPVHTMHGVYLSPGSVPAGTSVGPGYTDNAWQPLNLSPSHFGASRHVPDGTDSFQQQSHVATSNAHFNAPGQGLAHTVPRPFPSGQAWGFPPRPPFDVPIRGVRPSRFPGPWAARPSQSQPPVHTPGMSVQNVDVAPLDLGVYDSIGELVTAYQSSEQSDRDMATASLTQIVEHAISARNMLQKLSSATRPSMRHMTAAVDRVTRYDDLITALKSKGCEVPDADVSFAMPAPPDTARTNASSDARTRTSSRGYSSAEIRIIRFAYEIRIIRFAYEIRIRFCLSKSRKAQMKTSHHDKFYAKCDSVDLYNHVRKVMAAGYNSQNKRPTDGPSARVAVQGQPESDSATALMAEQI